MERNIRRIGLVNLLVFLVVGAAALVLARYGDTLAGLSASIFFLLGLLVMAVSYFQMRLEESERLEALEVEEMARGPGRGESLFESSPAEVFPAKRAREQFERFFVPVFTVLLFLAQGGAAYWVWRWLDRQVEPAVKNPILVLAWFAVFFLILFLVGKYSTHLTRLEQQRLLRPGASYLVLGAYLCAAVSISVGFVSGGVPQADLYLARAMAVLLGLMAVETLINLILEIYRPRVRGKVPRVLYESRLVGLLAQPEGIFTTAAHALDYQFGFKVSETWFYRFLEKALAWLILIQLAVLILSTCFVFIEPGEQALIERFGRPLSLEKPLGPGVHLKLPWPFDKVYRSHTDKIQTIHIGFVEEDEEEGHEDHGEEPETLVWTISHHEEEYNLLIGSRVDRSGSVSTNGAPTGQGVPADLVSVNIPVQYQINDLFAWTYNYVDAGKVLEDLATREVVRYLAGADLFSLMSTGRVQAAQELRTLIQKRADGRRLGVRVVFVGVQGIHPPVSVASAFEEVDGAAQEIQATVHQAEGYRLREAALASARAEERVRQARAYGVGMKTSAEAEAAQFTNQVAAFATAPEVFANRKVLEVWTGATNVRPFVMLVTNTQDVITIDLQEKLRPDMGDLIVPPADE